MLPAHTSLQSHDAPTDCSDLLACLRVILKAVIGNEAAVALLAGRAWLQVCVCVCVCHRGGGGGRWKGGGVNVHVVCVVD